MIRVKICGLTQSDDARAAVEAGADAIGLNFVGGPRRIDASRAEQILRVLPSPVIPVALVDLASGRLQVPTPEWLLHSGIRHLQVYGTPPPEVIAPWVEQGFTMFAVLRVRDAAICTPDENALVMASQGVVLDAYRPDQLGGTGHAFCWDWLTAAREAGRLEDWPPILLAGGLTPENVAEAVRRVRPSFVDVASGVEIDGRPGRKDPDKMRRFILAARSAGE